MEDILATGGAESADVEPHGEVETQADAEGALDLESEVKTKEKPWTRAEKRIRQLVQEKKEAIAAREAEREARATLEAKLTNLEAKLDRAVSKDTGPKGAFDSYGSDDLFALKAKYLDSNSQEYSPAMVAKLDQEILERKIKEVETTIRAKVEAEQKAKSDHARVFNETVAELGEAGRELSNPQSPLYRLANQRYSELMREYGKETVERVPAMQRLAIMDAYHKLRTQSGDDEIPRGVNQPRGRLQAKEQLSAESEAAVSNANEVKSLLAKRDVKGALAKLPLLQGMAEDIGVMRRR